MKTKLTGKDAEKIFELRQAYARKALSYREIDEDRLKKDVEWLYGLAKLKRPNVIVVNSLKDTLALCDSFGTEHKFPGWPGKNVGSDLKNIIVRAKRSFHAKSKKKMSAKLTAMIMRATNQFVSQAIGDWFFRTAENDLLRRIIQELLGELGDHRKSAERIYVYATLLNQGYGHRLNAERDRKALMLEDGIGGFFIDVNELNDYIWYFGLFCDLPGLAYYDAAGETARIWGGGFRVLMRLRDLLFNGVFCLHTFEEAAIATRMPERLIFGRDGVIHSVSEAAVQWVGGYKNYFLFGIGVSEPAWKYLVSPKMNFVLANRIKEADIRNLALEVLGPERIFNECRPRLDAESKRGNSLWTNSFGDRPISFLRYRCPSTGKAYTKFVPPNFVDPDDAQAWCFGITPEEYRNLAAEA